eukprot:TRINITY_DN1117_c0_g1_i1.p1 TRINITY_DN1117_c0_g1~~TRINITY_DN1117_c0_g1_i1.p1  ORF type:complete len:404 (-),score=141.49 TRINITY_DN1117_c0_g1_i1:157-1368(-)
MAAPPKKAEQPRKPVPQLGRLGKNLAIGIVGLPNVGKSTLFNLLGKCTVPASNYPFCTIDPNEAKVAVPDERYEFLCEMFKPQRRFQAALNITDIAGLVKGASTGAGLGNAFLSHIRAVDAIFEVVRIFEDEDVTHVEGAVDPVRDLQIITDELLIKDQETIANRVEAVNKQLRTKRDKAALMELDDLQKFDDWITKTKRPIRFGEWKVHEVETLIPLQLLTAKPVVYLVNMSKEDFAKKRNKWLMPIKKWIDTNSEPFAETIIPFCGALEAEAMEEAIKNQAGKDDINIQAAGTLSKIIKIGYHTLDLIHFFTCGADEVKCWTIRRGTKAPQAAGTIHTDFEKGFVCAEVMSFVDLKELGSEQAVKNAGKYHQQGKNYEMLDGDIVFFKANTAGLDKKKKPE